MANNGAHIRYVEPLSKAVKAALDAAGMTPADATRVTGLSSQLLSQILNRRERYTRPPKIDTMQKLARIPGLTITDVARAVSISVGYPLPAEVTGEATSALRRSVHNVIDDFPEEHLSGVLQVLLAVQQIVAGRRNRGKG